MKSINPAKGWHHVQVRDASHWPIVATVQFGRKAEATDRSDFGIQARLGRQGGKGPSRPVVLLFDPRLWTLARAKKWAKDHGETVIEAVEAPEKPDYELSGRARAIKATRGKADVVKEYRLDLLHAGVGFENPKIDREKTIAAARKQGLEECAVFALKHGWFTDGERKILIVPGELSGVVETAGVSKKSSSPKKSASSRPSKKPAGKRTKKRWFFQVSPAMELSGRHLPFPGDMLRYDTADFVSEKDKKKALAKKPGALLVSELEPTPGRWESYGWTVDWAKKA